MSPHSSRKAKVDKTHKRKYHPHILQQAKATPTIIFLIA